MTPLDAGESPTCPWCGSAMKVSDQNPPEKQPESFAASCSTQQCPGNVLARWSTAQAALAAAHRPAPARVVLPAVPDGAEADRIYCDAMADDECAPTELPSGGAWMRAYRRWAQAQLDKRKAVTESALDVADTGMENDWPNSLRETISATIDAVLAALARRGEAK